MPIQSLDPHSIEQRCLTCGVVRCLRLDALELRLVPAVRPTFAPAFVDIPPCADCGSGECLIASPAAAAAHPAPGGYGFLHALLVDHLVARLVDERMDADADGLVPSLRRPTAEDLAAWFPHGLVLESP